MNQKLLPQITVFVFAVFIALGPACTIVSANGEAETSPVPQQQLLKEQRAVRNVRMRSKKFTFQEAQKEEYANESY
jgi:hypothetical protein